METLKDQPPESNTDAYVKEAAELRAKCYYLTYATMSGELEMLRGILNPGAQESFYALLGRTQDVGTLRRLLCQLQAMRQEEAEYRKKKQSEHIEDSQIK
jgi:hypothetical protein